MPTRKAKICCSMKCRRWRYYGTTDPAERVCAHPGCGRTFLSRIGHRLYCHSAGCEYPRKAARSMATNPQPLRACAGPGCSVTFVPPTKRRQFCSPRCAKNAAYRRQHPRTLPQRACLRPGCSNTFQPSRVTHVYCSPECGAAIRIAKPWKVPKICALPGCGRTFTPVQERQKCCSRQCRVWLDYGGTYPVERVCARCGNIFISRVKNQKYCSKRCSDAVAKQRHFRRLRAARTEGKRNLAEAAENVSRLRKELEGAEEKLRRLLAGMKREAAPETVLRLQLLAIHSEEGFKGKVLAALVYPEIKDKGEAKGRLYILKSRNKAKLSEQLELVRKMSRNEREHLAAKGTTDLRKLLSLP